MKTDPLVFSHFLEYIILVLDDSMNEEIDSASDID